MALLGIDLGTSAVKVLVISDDGVVLGSHTTGYPLAAPRPHWSEQNPEDWWTGTVDAVRGALANSKVSASEIRGIGLSGQMHGLTLLDKHDKVLRPAILWNDQRTAPQVQQMIDTVGGKRGVRKLMTNFPSTSYTAPKILWVREHEPKVYGKSNKILLPKDYVRFRLSGEYATEVTDATGMALLDIKKRQWSDKVLALFDIPKEFLPRVEESHVVSAVGERGRRRDATGLAAGTPIVGGAGDQAAAGVGAGAVRSGIVWSSSAPPGCSSPPWTNTKWSKAGSKLSATRCRINGTSWA